MNHQNSFCNMCHNILTTYHILFLETFSWSCLCTGCISVWAVQSLVAWCPYPYLQHTLLFLQTVFFFFVLDLHPVQMQWSSLHMIGASRPFFGNKNFSFSLVANDKKLSYIYCKQVTMLSLPNCCRNIKQSSWWRIVSFDFL